MSSASIVSNVSNLLKPLICSIRSLSLVIAAAPRLYSPTSTSTAGPITWAMLHWLWLSSTASLKARSSSRSRENPIAPPRLNRISLLQTIKAQPNSSVPTSHRPLPPSAFIVQPHGWPQLLRQNGPVFSRHRQVPGVSCSHLRFCAGNRPLLFPTEDSCPQLAFCDCNLQFL